MQAVTVAPVGLIVAPEYRFAPVAVTGVKTPPDMVKGTAVAWHAIGPDHLALRINAVQDRAGRAGIVDARECALGAHDEAVRLVGGIDVLAGDAAARIHPAVDLRVDGARVSICV